MKTKNGTILESKVKDLESRLLAAEVRNRILKEIIQGENFKIKEKLAIAEGQLQKADKIIEKLLDQRQNITISGEHAVVNVGPGGSINKAEGMNSRIDNL